MFLFAIHRIPTAIPRKSYEKSIYPSYNRGMKKSTYQIGGYYG